MRPARGVCFFRKIETADMIGSIVVPQQTIEKLVAMQGEVVAVGAPEWCDDEDCKRPHGWHVVKREYHPPKGPLKLGVLEHIGTTAYRRVHEIPPHLKPGSWVLLAPRSWVETPDPQLYATTTDSILGVYQSPK